MTHTLVPPGLITATCAKPIAPEPSWRPIRREHSGIRATRAAIHTNERGVAVDRPTLSRTNEGDGVLCHRELPTGPASPE